MKFFSRKVLFTKGKPYLVRWTLFQCKLFSIKIHKALISDEGHLHDHPWSYLSIILQGGYYEITQTEDGTLQKKWYGPGSILVRNAAVPHKLEIPEGKFCRTLIFTTGKWREWGIIVKNKWVSRKLLNFK